MVQFRKYNEILKMAAEEELLLLHLVQLYQVVIICSCVSHRASTVSSGTASHRATNCEGQHMLSALNIAGPIWLNSYYTEQLKTCTSVNVKSINCVYLLGHQLNVTPPRTRRQKLLINQKLTWFRRKKNNVSLIFSKGLWINKYILKRCNSNKKKPPQKNQRKHIFISILLAALNIIPHPKHDYNSGSWFPFYI